MNSTDHIGEPNGMITGKRQVHIKFIKDSWVVLYLDRVKHGRYAAASFYGRDHDRSNVVAWVKSKTNLELVEGQVV